MTLVEFFDGVSICNMASCFMLKPEKIIFIGENKPMRKQEEAYRRLIKSRGLNITLDYRPINRNSVDQIVSVLENIVETEGNCTFDLTGGEDLVLVSMGIVFAKYRGTGKLQMHRINVNTGKIYDCDSDGLLPQADFPTLSVRENVMLYGGCVVPYNGKKGTYNWILDDEFKSDLKNMWSICKKNPGLWNSQTGTLDYMAEKSNAGAALSVSVCKSDVEALMKKKKKKYAWVPGLMKAFDRCGLITDFADSDDDVSFTFKNEQIKQCLTKEGLLLELMVLIFAKAAEEKDGTPKFNDVVNGVYIDWDADIHDIRDDEKDTENEVDIILMKGYIPVFVSCKNGYFDETELYKLNTVAQKFGGPYAKKVLVASYYGKNNEDSHRYFEQRAEDMGIDLIENIHELSDDTFAKKIGNILA